MGNSIKDIKAEFESVSINSGDLNMLYKKYSTDERAGVRTIISKYKKQEEKLALERMRLEKMHEYEYTYDNHEFICGIDEAGRGPLAGPVVAGAVILPKDC